MLFIKCLRDLVTEFGDQVVRIHRNTLVLMSHLEGLERDACGHYQVKMRGIDERLDVSRRQVSGVLRLVQSLQDNSAVKSSPALFPLTA